MLVFILLPALAQQPSGPMPTFRAGVTLVKVDAQVTDRRGRIIPDLTAGDFRVLDNGQPQKIAHFGREAEPLDLLLLLDISGSMRRSIEEMAKVARSALGALNTGDRVAVMLFARDTAVREEFTADFAAVEQEIRDAVRGQNLGSGTAINASVVKAAEYMRTQPRKGRRAILIVTDNQSLNYLVPDDVVLRTLYGADTVFNAILIGKQRRPDPPRPGAYVNPDFTPSDIFKIAEETGGEAVEARNAGASFREMIERIRARYSLEYAAPPAAAGEFRRIRVELTPAARARKPDAIIRARAAYYAE